jgi:hypothetical protein
LLRLLWWVLPDTAHVAAGSGAILPEITLTTLDMSTWTMRFFTWLVVGALLVTVLAILLLIFVTRRTSIRPRSLALGTVSSSILILLALLAVVASHVVSFSLYLPMKDLTRQREDFWPVKNLTSIYYVGQARHADDEEESLLIYRKALDLHASLGPDLIAKTIHTPEPFDIPRGRADHVRLLIEAGADVNGDYEDGYTALMIAAEWNQPEITKILLEAGADVNAVSDNGWTALRVASALGHNEVAELLKQAGAQ